MSRIRSDITSIPSLQLENVAGPEQEVPLPQPWGLEPPAVDAGPMISVDGHCTRSRSNLESGIWNLGNLGIREISLSTTARLSVSHRANDVIFGSADSGGP